MPGHGGIRRRQDAAAAVGAGKGPVLMDDDRPITAEVAPIVVGHSVIVADPTGAKKSPLAPFRTPQDPAASVGALPCQEADETGSQPSNTTTGLLKNANSSNQDPYALSQVPPRAHAGLIAGGRFRRRRDGHRGRLGPSRI